MENQRFEPRRDLAPEAEEKKTAGETVRREDQRKETVARRDPCRYPLCHFDGHKLVMRTGSRVAVFKPWPEMFAARKDFFGKHTAWSRFRPQVGLKTGYLSVNRDERSRPAYEDRHPRPGGFRPRQEKAREACQAFFASIPAEVAD